MELDSSLKATKRKLFHQKLIGGSNLLRFAIDHRTIHILKESIISKNILFGIHVVSLV